MLICSRASIILLLACSALFQTAEGDLIDVFKRAEDDLIESDDCNPAITKQTLKLLQLTKSEELTKEQVDATKYLHRDAEDSSKLVDCTIRKTNFDKLRTFMVNSGYIQNPGSLHLINDQDTNLKLHCGQEGRWRAVDLNTEEEDKAFNEFGHFSEALNIASPVGYRYFRKFACFSLKKQCTHTFYVVTRPRPRLEFPLQAMDGDDFKFQCEISACTSGKPDIYHEEGCKVGGKKVDTNPQGPYSIELRVPGSIFKKGKAKELAMKSCVDDMEVVKDPVYLKVIEDGKAIAEGIPKDLQGGFQIKPMKNRRGMKMEIKKVLKKDHAGFYECVVIDKNGIPSTPWYKNFTYKRRYSGKAKLHVRAIVMVIIPAAIIGGTLVLMFIIWIVFRKHDHMENDDGTPYPKDELVTPVQEPEAEKTEKTDKPTNAKTDDKTAKVDDKPHAKVDDNQEKPKKE